MPRVVSIVSDFLYMLNEPCVYRLYGDSSFIICQDHNVPSSKTTMNMITNTSINTSTNTNKNADNCGDDNALPRFAN